MSKEYFEKYTNAQLTELIRSAMSEGCIKPCHIYDAVDILLDRLADKPQRNCDVGSVEEQEERFKNFCLSYYEHGECWRCPLFKSKIRCPIAWGQLPYEEEKEIN